MGATVVRSHTLGISVGCSLCIEPSFDQLNRGQANETALEHVDYAIKVARDLGIRLIVPLTDNYEYYHGGKHNFTDWRCIPYEYQKCISMQNQFYTDKNVIGYFESYISILLNHVNVYTGVAYKNDPTILAWEEGNELDDAPPDWVGEIATYLKRTLQVHQLVAFTERAGIQDTTLLSIPDVDIVDVHYYPMSVSTLEKDASTVIQYHKVFYVGEFAWNSGSARGSGDSLSNFLSAIEINGTSVDTFWSLFAHGDSCNYLQHGDGYTLHYPGDDNNMRASVQLLRTHAHNMYNYPGIPSKPACGTSSPE
jgi:mannan endo-1,4-beta-mannosidase